MLSKHQRDPLARRPGFTLIELLTVVVVSATLLGSTLPLLIHQQRHVVASADAMGLRRAARHGSHAFAYEVRQIDPHVGDILTASPTQFEFRAATGNGVICGVGPTRALITVPPLRLVSRGALTAWVAAPRRSDSVLVLDRGHRPGPEDDRWRGYELVADATTSACSPASGLTASASESAAGWGLPLSSPLDSTIATGAPLRLFRRARYQLYRSSTDGGDYLGYTECPLARCATIQPVAGPFAGPGAIAGMTLDYRDSTGLATADTRAVTRIDVVMRVRSKLPYQTGGRSGPYSDSPHSSSRLATDVTMRDTRRMTLNDEKRSGFVLLAVLLALLVMGLLGAGILYASTQEFRDARGQLAQVAAHTAAETGLATARSEAMWDRAWNLSARGTVIVRAIDVGVDAVDTVRVVSLGNWLFQVVSESRATHGAHAVARARIGQLVTLSPPRLTVSGALVAQSSVTIDAARVSGRDTTSGLGFDTSASDVPGVSMADTTVLSLRNCPTSGCVVGSSGYATDGASIAASVLSSDFGALSAASDHPLAAGALITLPGPTLTAGGSCDRVNPNNWGDPLGAATDAPCGDYSPVLHAAGDLAIEGGVGQGTLLVDGDLRVSGGFQWHGVVLVRGALEVSGSGTQLFGAVVVGGRAATVRDRAEVRRSSAELERAMMAVAHPVAVTERSWTELPQ